jgi:hypothetical protein
MYVDNRLEVAGKPVKLKLKDGSLTEYALRESLKLYEARYGELKELHGSLAAENLANFQREFAIRRKQEMDVQPAAEQAIREISFGKARIKVGYTIFEVSPDSFGIKQIAGVGPFHVPSRVSVVAKKP